MTDEQRAELERRLSAAFQAKAQASFPDQRTPPPMRLPDHLSPRPHRRHLGRRGGGRRWLAPLAAAAAVVLVVGIVLALTRGSTGGKGHVAFGANGRASASSIAPSDPGSSAAATSSAPATGAPVQVSSAVISDGSTVGVGMPIIVLLSRPISDAREFARATTVTVNGRAAAGGWYFERKYGDPGHPIEADYRTSGYWPGHASIHLDLAVQGRSAGTGLVFANDLSLQFSTGAAHVLTVDNATHRLSVLSDGKQWPSAGVTFPVSLGSSATPTKRGTKVIMEKGRSICMSGPGYRECGVKYTQRLTYGGEYLHAAPWNLAHIASGINSSNGCTNLTPADAKKLYDFLEVGDVVKYPNADGPLMQLGDGYGDWNLSWAQWRTGGLYAVS